MKKVYMKESELYPHNGFYVRAILSNIEFLSRREESKYQDENLGRKFFNEYLNTIRLSIPRRNGNTEIALCLLDILKNACLIIPKGKDISYIEKRKRINFTTFDRNVYSQGEFIQGESVLKLKKYDYVILNDSHNFVDVVQSVLLPKAFIILG